MSVLVTTLGWCFIAFGVDSFELNPNPHRAFDHKTTMITNVITNLTVALPTTEVTLVFHFYHKPDLITSISTGLYHFGVKVGLFQIPNDDMDGTNLLDKFRNDLKHRTDQHSDGVYFLFVPEYVAEEIVQMISSENWSRRNLLFIFIWESKKLSPKFYTSIQETMRVCVVLNPRYGKYQIYYNQAKPHGEGHLDMVNWWVDKNGLFHRPLLPNPIKVYSNFKGRIFVIPVLHKPPWHFVIYNNNSIEVDGGRDDQLMSLLSRKLNFRYEYMDPPDRTQGSGLVNGSIQGALGLVWMKEAEMFIGDLTVTYERSLVVDFTFFTLTDVEVFLTHAPGRLNEALVLVRPFKWQVWPAVLTTIFMSGPLLYLLTWAAGGWKYFRFKLLADCIWITTSIFLRQSSFKANRVRLLITILYLISTYIIGDMYLANLTSMFARPPKEKPISTLEQLDQAMAFKGFELLVEKHSASHAVFENGTGLYKSIWNKMKVQNNYFVDSTEEAMISVKKHKNVALIGGRETFYYNTIRFGAQHFHLSEKLYSRYSAIAVQKGCPFISNFNDALFEVGVLTKITEDEYQKLIKKKPAAAEDQKKNNVGEGEVQMEDDSQLKAMTMKTLRGAFYVLVVGYTLGALVLLLEKICHP